MTFFSFCLIELTDDLEAMGGTSNKFREQPHKMLSDDKDMSNCFGFDVSFPLINSLSGSIEISF